MAQKRHTPEQVINKLREAAVAIAEGSTVAQAARRIGVTEQTLLPVAQRIRESQDRPGQAAEESGGGPDAGQPDTEGDA